MSFLFSFHVYLLHQYKMLHNNLCNIITTGKNITQQFDYTFCLKIPEITDVQTCDNSFLDNFVKILAIFPGDVFAFRCWCYCSCHLAWTCVHRMQIDSFFDALGWLTNKRTINHMFGIITIAIVTIIVVIVIALWPSSPTIICLSGIALPPAMLQQLKTYQLTNDKWTLFNYHRPDRFGWTSMPLQFGN